MASPDEQTFQQLLDVGIALTSEHNLNRLLTRILTEARRLTGADAGTLYLVESGQLKAEVGQCQTLVHRWGPERAAGVFESFTLPISMDSIAGAAAHTQEIVNIPDVQSADKNCRFHYDPSYDKKHDYSTHSNLAVPLLDPDGTVIGVLQLINATARGRVVPFDTHRVKLARALASQAAVSIRNARLTQDLRAAHLDTLRRLGVAAEWRDKETANHITRVSRYSGILAETMGWSGEMVELVTLASPMHDVGKLGVPDAILHKPGKLDAAERKIMETHAVIGANIMADANNEVMAWSRMVALGHHERWDGKGYPQQLRSGDIPPVCRIVAFADVYDALSSRRVYKPAFPPDKVMHIIEEETGAQLDPAVVEAFRAALDRMADVRDRYMDQDEDFEKFRDYEHIALEGA